MYIVEPCFAIPNDCFIWACYYNIGIIRLRGVQCIKYLNATV